MCGSQLAGRRWWLRDPDSTEVVYKIRQWSLPGAAIVPVPNVSSRVFWLELDDKALLDSYTVLQEGILCDVFWPTFTTRGTLTEEVSEQVFSKERARKHLWMEIKLRWRVLADRMYTRSPRESPKMNSMLCFLTGLPGVTARTRMKRNHIEVQQTMKSKHGGSNVKTGWNDSEYEALHLLSTSRVSYRRYHKRKQKLSRKWMHLWSIVPKGGRQERALINSSDVG